MQMNDDQFFGWWNGDDLTPDNDFPKDSPIWCTWDEPNGSLSSMEVLYVNYGERAYDD